MCTVPWGLRCRQDRISGIPLVAVCGEVDIATAPALRDALYRQAPAGDPPRLIVDLSEVPFIDSEGLRVLLRARKDYPGGLALVGATGAVSRVLSITGAERLFIMASSAKRAADLLAGRHAPRRRRLP